MSGLERLKQRVKTRQNELEWERNERVRQDENSTTVNEAKDVDIIPFYCTDCELDSEGVGHKVIETDWTNKDNIAFYVGHCEKGHRCIKRITDKVTDPYYNLSEIVHNQRIDAKDDMLTPNDYGFRALYGNPFDND